MCQRLICVLFKTLRFHWGNIEVATAVCSSVFTTEIALTEYTHSVLLSALVWAQTSSWFVFQLRISQIFDNAQLLLYFRVILGSVWDLFIFLNTIMATWS